MVNPIISAHRYNVLYQQINAILGTPSGNSGYNQNVQSQSLPVKNIVYADDMNRLFFDFQKVYVHQNGSQPTTIFEVTSDEQITEGLYAAYETLAPLLFTNRTQVDASQIDNESAGVDSTRTATWGGTGTPQSITHEFKVTFSSESHLRGFFNAGGNIEFTFTMTSAGADAKSQGWYSMINNIGTVTIDVDSTTATGTGNIFPELTTGIYNVGTTYQRILLKPGSGIYAANDLEIYAKRNSNVLQFKTVMTDDAVGTNPGGAGPIDETVTGTISSQIRQNRPIGSYVSIPTPAYQNLTTLQ